LVAPSPAATPIRHAVGSETQIWLNRLADGAVQLRLHRRPPDELSTAPDAFQPTAAGLIVPGHLLETVAADLVALSRGAA
jgi:hypothetical protein